MYGREELNVMFVGNTESDFMVLSNPLEAHAPNFHSTDILKSHTHIHSSKSLVERSP